MSAVHQIQSLWSVYEAAGPYAALDYLPGDLEWVPSSELPCAEVVCGLEEIRATLDRLGHAGVRFEPTLHTYEALDEEMVLVGGRVRVVEDAALSDSPRYWLCRMRGDDLVRIESFASRDDALQAAAPNAVTP